jgi:hypothetical protein
MRTSRGPCQAGPNGRGDFARTFSRNPANLISTHFPHGRITMPAFPDISPIKYEGPGTQNPLAFRQYNPDEQVEGKSTRDHLRFAVCYWHTFRGMGGDPFGSGIAIRPWEDGHDSTEIAIKRLDQAAPIHRATAQEVASTGEIRAFNRCSSNLNGTLLWEGQHSLGDASMRTDAVFMSHHPKKQAAGPGDGRAGDRATQDRKEVHAIDSDGVWGDANESSFRSERRMS